MITAAGQFTADDYVAANKLHMQQRGWKRVAWIVFWVVLGVGALLSADVAVQDPDAGLTPLLLILLVAALQLFLRIVYVPRRARRLYRQQRNLRCRLSPSAPIAGSNGPTPTGGHSCPGVM